MLRRVGSAAPGESCGACQRNCEGVHVPEPTTQTRFSQVPSTLGSVHVDSTLSARARRIELSPTAFRKIALSSAGWLYLIVVTGATVRLTASGLGCEHWPGCSAANPFPSKSYH